METVLEVQNLTKYYRQHFWTPRRKVLDSVSFSVRSGEVFGFLGPNGSGKSTSIKILLEIIFPSSGSAKIFGKPPGDKEAKKNLGFLPENPYFYDHLTAVQFLSLHGALWGMNHREVLVRIPEVLELVGMRGTENERLRAFSKGMLQRIGLAQAILHDPDLVILDEPMTGLDPLGRKEVRDLMLDLKSRGKTIFFSTHILSDVESVADRVAILNYGKLLSLGSLDELVSVDSKYCDIVWQNRPEEIASWIEKSGCSEEIVTQGETTFVKIFPKERESQEDFEARINGLIQEGLQSGMRLREMAHKRDDLEDIFVERVGHMEKRI